MTPTLRRRLIIIAALAVLPCVWLAAGVYVGRLASAELEAQVQRSAQSPAYRLRNLQHNAGLWWSSGEFELALVDACAQAERGPERLAARVSYRLAHLPGPNALLSMEWSLTPSGDARKTFETLFGGVAQLEGHGRVRYSGVLESDMRLPAMSWLERGVVLNISPSYGRVAVGADTMDFDWTTERISFRGEGQAIEIDGLHLQSDLSSRRRGLGQVSLSIARFGSSSVTAEDIRLMSAMVENGDRVDMRIIPAIRSLAIGEMRGADLQLEMALTGMDAKSIEFLIDLAQRSCNFRNLTQQESQQLRVHARQLLYRGLSAGIEKIGGRFNGGQLDGRFVLALSPTDGARFALEQVLKLDGRLSLSGKDFAADDQHLLVNLGFVPQPDGVQLRFDYASGVASVNGEGFDAQLFFDRLQGLNDVINDLLTGARASPKTPSPAPDQGPEHGDPAQGNPEHEGRDVSAERDA